MHTRSPHQRRPLLSERSFLDEHTDRHGFPGLMLHHLGARSHLLTSPGPPANISTRSYCAIHTCSDSLVIKKCMSGPLADVPVQAPRCTVHRTHRLTPDCHLRCPHDRTLRIPRPLHLIGSDVLPSGASPLHCRLAQIEMHSSPSGLGRWPRSHGWRQGPTFSGSDRAGVRRSSTVVGWSPANPWSSLIQAGIADPVQRGNKGRDSHG